MLVRVVVIYALLTVCAFAFHENTYAVFELREQLLRLTLNLWELLEQLKYVTADQRPRVYSDIEHITQEINRIIDQLLQHDQQQHP